MLDISTTAPDCRGRYHHRMAQPTATQPNQETPPIELLGGKIEELFVQQYDRLAFHNNEQENDYRRQEERLSSLMLDKTLTNEVHLEHARSIIALTEKYKGAFLKSLHSLNADIDRHLAAFEHELETLLGSVKNPTPELTTLLEKSRRCLALSKDLQKARLVAVQTVVMRVDCDATLPNIIIRNEGRADIMLTAEETRTFQQTLADASIMLKQSFEDNERIQKERLPLAKELFRSEDTSSNAKQPAEAHPETNVQTAIQRVHPLQGRAWFRLFKIVYICLGVIVAGFCVLFAFSGDGANLAIGIASVSALAFFLLRKGFYYTTLGRTTVHEQPGSGFLDLDDLKSDFDSLKASSPEQYQSLVAPFLDTWKQQYCRRVPVQAYQVFRKRVDAELEELRTKKQKVIDDAAKKGTVIEISVLRRNMERTKAEYEGADRASYDRGIDDWLIKLEAKYGTSIPVDEASKILDELEDKIRKDEQL
jgi:hypothetical protein